MEPWLMNEYHDESDVHEIGDPVADLLGQLRAAHPGHEMAAKLDPFTMDAVAAVNGVIALKALITAMLAAQNGLADGYTRNRTSRLARREHTHGAFAVVSTATLPSTVARVITPAGPVAAVPLPVTKLISSSRCFASAISPGIDRATSGWSVSSS